jgi:hypothetical protein
VPVRFRCDTCNGKLSIATRKIGQSVACPRCHESMTVPSASQIGEELTELLLTVGRSQRETNGVGSEQSLSKTALRPGKSLDEMPLFERSDYEKLLDPHAKLPKPLPLPSEVPLVAIPATQPLAITDAIIIGRTKATVLAVVMVLLLGLAFGLGYFIRG